MHRLNQEIRAVVSAFCWRGRTSFFGVLQIRDIVFMGGLWYALSIIGLGMTYCVGKAMLDTMHGHGDGHGHGHDSHH